MSFIAAYSSSSLFTAGSVSITIATITLLGIIVYHVTVQVHKRKCLSCLLPRSLKNMFKNINVPNIFKRRNDYQAMNDYFDGDEYDRDGVN